MRHEVFEEWIFNGESLSEKEVESLQLHLGICESCNLHYRAKSEVEGLFKSEKLSTPIVGFASRWRKRLMDKSHLERVHKHRHLSIFSLLLTSGIATIMLVPLVIYANQNLEPPIRYLIGVVNNLVDIYLFIKIIQLIITTFLKVIVLIVPISYWLLMMAIFSTLCFIWLYTLKPLSSNWRAS
ncbi:MAG: hypothetical protein IBX69_08625 [Anaerolineales bacterium]|nr:hypothetical protein [Anaerolineales bacterium]